MDYIYFVLVLVIFGLGLWVWKLRNDKIESDREAEALAGEKDEYMEMGKGLAEYQQKLNEKKEKIKSEILALAKEKSKISNKDVSEKLGIPRTSAFRYLDELEKAGKLKQVGKTGASVVYVLV